MRKQNNLPRSPSSWDLWQGWDSNPELSVSKCSWLSGCTRLWSWNFCLRPLNHSDLKKKNRAVSRKWMKRRGHHQKPPLPHALKPCTHSHTMKQILFPIQHTLTPLVKLCLSIRDRLSSPRLSDLVTLPGQGALPGRHWTLASSSPSQTSRAPVTILILHHLSSLGLPVALLWTLQFAYTQHNPSFYKLSSTNYLELPPRPPPKK